MKKNNSNKISKIACLEKKWRGHNMNEICWVFFLCECQTMRKMLMLKILKS